MKTTKHVVLYLILVIFIHDIHPRMLQTTRKKRSKIRYANDFARNAIGDVTSKRI